MFLHGRSRTHAVELDKLLPWTVAMVTRRVAMVTTRVAMVTRRVAMVTRRVAMVTNPHGLCDRAR